MGTDGASSKSSGERKLSNKTEALWDEVRKWAGEQQITLEGHELSSWPVLNELQRFEVLLKSAFVQWARSRPADVLGGAGEPIEVKMTYDPIGSPQRPIYGPIFGKPEKRYAIGKK